MVERATPARRRAGRGTPDAGGPAGRGGRDLAAVVHLATLVVGLAVLLWWGRGQWFAADEWAFLTERRDPSTVLLAHVGHWSTIPHLLYQGLYQLVGLRDYTPYLALHLLVHVGIVHLGWRLAVRAGADRWVATAGALVPLLLGAGAENVWWGFQVGLDGSVLVGLAVLLLLDREAGRGRDVAAAVLLTVALLLSGVTVAMVAGVAVALLLARGWRAAVGVCLAPTLLYFAWATTVWLPSLPADREPGAVSVEAFAFAGTILANTLAAVVRAPLAVGAVLLVAAVAAVVAGTTDRLARQRRSAVLGAAAAGVVFALLTGISRAELGAEAALASRYVYVTVVLLWPLVVVALGRVVAGAEDAEARRTDGIRPDPVATRVLLAAGLLVVAGVQAALLRDAAAAQATEERRTEREVVAAAQVLADRDVDAVGDTPVLAGRAQGLTTTILREMVAEGALPEDVALAPTDRVAARAALLVRPVPDHPVPPAGALPCVEVAADAPARLAVPAPSRFAVRVDPDTVEGASVSAPAATLQVEVTEAGVPAPRPRRLDLDAGTTVVAVDLAEADLVLSVPPDAPSVEVCGPLQ